MCWPRSREMPVPEQQPQQRSPKPADVWQKNGSERRVRVEAVDNRWAEARNTKTGRLSRIELYTFTRKGKAGWTLVEEAPSA